MKHSSCIAAAVFALAALLASCQLASIPTTPANRYALVIGVQDYPTDYKDLQFPDDDARDMADLLSTQGWTVTKRLISTNDLSIATDGSPTYAAIESAVASLSADPNATILVYFSGHGATDSDYTYIVPYDGIVVDPGSNYGSNIAKWITPATLTLWMTAVPAKNRLLILDSCDSGGFVTSDVAVDTAPADYSQMGNTTSDTGLIAAALSKLNTMLAANVTNFGSKEVQVLSASGSEESSYDDDGTLGFSLDNGVFTYFLLQAGEPSSSNSLLLKGDANKDGVVTIDEAYVYAKAQIKLNWNSTNYHKWADMDLLPHISGGTRDVVLYAGS
ncbi:MAG: caspase family protein [Spirochaetes bacterium]|nr:caspase family protein [Spirochaetota bacterium]